MCVGVPRSLARKNGASPASLSAAKNRMNTWKRRNTENGPGTSPTYDQSPPSDAERRVFRGSCFSVLNLTAKQYSASTHRHRMSLDCQWCAGSKPPNVFGHGVSERENVTSKTTMRTRSSHPQSTSHRYHQEKGGSRP